MSIFDRVATLLAWLPVAAAAGAPGCGAESGDCLRYSDCAPGLTCAAGRCVPPPAPASFGVMTGAGASGGDAGAVAPGDDASDDDASDDGGDDAVAADDATPE